MVMKWIAAQEFAQSTRHCMANTNLNSRSRFIWRRDKEEEEEEENRAAGNDGSLRSKLDRKKPLFYTPAFGSHLFWFKNRPCLFTRFRGQQSGIPTSESEEISISCFGRRTRLLKELIYEARAYSVLRDEQKTLIYRGMAGASDLFWQRSMAKKSRPLSMVILDEQVKKHVLDDMKEYLHPTTRKWYSKRGIPYRRGYLFHGSPGTARGWSDSEQMVSRSFTSTVKESCAASAYRDPTEGSVANCETLKSWGVTSAGD